MPCAMRHPHLSCARFPRFRGARCPVKLRQARHNRTQEGGGLRAGIGSRILLVCALLPAATSVRCSEPFYRGKRLTLLINFAAGGPTDIEGRLFAKHIGRHIDGEPNIIIQNMEGAGGIVGAKYAGEVAPRDGTFAGYFTGTTFIYALDPERFRVDFKSY